MWIKKNCLLFFGLFVFFGFTQENKHDFMAFGKMPRVVSHSIFKSLNNSENKQVRLRYIDTIASIYLRSGHADSLMHYGKLLKHETPLANVSVKKAKQFQLKSFYYEGLAAQKMGLFDEAINAFIKGIAIAEQDDVVKKYLELQLGETYLAKGELQKAQDIINELPQPDASTDFYLKNTVVKSRSLILNAKYDMAKTLILEALSEDFIQDYKKLKLELQLNISEIHLKQKDYERLIANSDAIKTEALNEGFYDLYIEATLYVGFAYAMLQEYSVAEIVLSSAFVNTMQWNRLELQQKIINALVKLYSKKGDFKNAYSLMTQYQRNNKTIASKQNQRLIKDLELKYETLKKEKEIDVLQEDQLLKAAEIERQKTIKYAFLIGFLIILVPIILLLKVYYQKLQTQSLLNKQQDAINQQEVQSLLQSQELELAKNTISVQSKERNRIARELHDSIGGNLAGIKLKMNTLENHVPEFRQILNQLDDTYEQVREISHSLVPKAFETNRFTDLVKHYVQNISEDVSVNLSFETYPDKRINTLDVQLQATLFNIIKELVTNAIKHAQAQDINIQLTFPFEEKSIELIYEDDGIGFDLNKVNKGIGLHNMETRVSEVKGIMSINTAKNRGTVISISIPQI